MLQSPVKAVGLATVMVASLFFQSCAMLTRAQTDDIHRKLDHNDVEVKRSERILELVNEGAIKADDIIKFIQQYNTVITNNGNAIRKHLPEPAEPEE